MVKIFQTYDIYLVQNIPKYRGFPIPKCRDIKGQFIDKSELRKTTFSSKKNVFGSCK